MRTINLENKALVSASWEQFTKQTTTCHIILI